MPELFELNVIRKKLGDVVSPTAVVLCQELERYNKLIKRMSTSLRNLQRVGQEPAQVIFIMYSVIFMTSLLQALAGEVGMSAELDEVARSLYNGQIPSIWRILAPATLKSLGNWMIHFLRRNEQYVKWV